MPQPMAASTIRKQSAAMAMPTGLPPMTTSESESAPAVWVRLPLEREYRPTANSAGSPAPASRPKTTIFQIALRLIQDIVCFPVAQAAVAGSGSAGATDPVHSSFTLVGSTLLARDLR